MGDPYKILGVSRDASDEEIKKAYHELARKYHPDNYMNNPLADLVQDKMKEINAAYEEITKQRSNKGSSAGAGYDYTSAGTGDFRKIRELINAGRNSDAEIILDSTPQSERGAEWNFLKGCVLTQRGWYYDAQKFFESACYMDPSNSEYQSALNNIRSSTKSYGAGYRTINPNRAGGTSICSICETLICMDCLCECCGGDLISCC